MSLREISERLDMSIQEMNISLQNPLFYEKKYFGWFLICFLGFGYGANLTTVYKKALNIFQFLLFTILRFFLPIRAKLPFYIFYQ